MSADWYIQTKNAIEKLRKGQVALINPPGGSMKGLIESGADVEVRPCKLAELFVGDVVMVQMGYWVYVHLIKKIDGNNLLIGNNRGKINGWAPFENVYGVVVKVNGNLVKKMGVS